MRRIEVALGLAIAVVAITMASPLGTRPAIAAFWVGVFGPAIAIDRVLATRRLERPVSRLVTLVLTSAIERRANRIYLRNVGTRFTIWFARGREQWEEMRPPRQLREPILCELAWRLRRWAANDVLVLAIGDRRVRLRIVFSIGEDLARIDLA